MIFPENFEKKPHPVVPNAIQYIGIKPNGQTISIVGGGKGLYGDGINTFEMWDFDEEEPRGYLNKEKINEYLSNIK